VSTKRRLAAILFADIAGFTRAMSDDEELGLERRRRMERAARDAAASHGGRLVKLLGDGAMLAFESAVEAVSAAIEIQRALAEAGTEPLPVRIGVHVGDVVEEDGDLYGNVVNIAQRVQEAALPGGIAITRDVLVQIRPILSLRVRPIRHPGGKPMPEPIEVYGIDPPGRIATRASRRRLALAGAVTLLLLSAAALVAFAPWGRRGSVRMPAPAGVSAPPATARGELEPRSGALAPAVGQQAPARASSEPKSAGGQTARTSPARLTAFAVAGGTYAVGEPLPIGGVAMGKQGRVYVGGVRAKVEQWTPERIVARVPGPARPGSLPVVVAPEGAPRLEAGSINVRLQEQAPIPRTPDRVPWAAGVDITGALARALPANRSERQPRLSSEDLRALRAIALLQAGRDEEAASEVSEALRRTEGQTGRSRTVALVGDALLKQRQGAPAEEVLQVFRSAAAADPRMPLVYYAWGKTLVEAGRTAEARKVLEEGLKRNRQGAVAMVPYHRLARQLGLPVPAQPPRPRWRDPAAMPSGGSGGPPPEPPGPPHGPGEP